MSPRAPVDAVPSRVRNEARSSPLSGRLCARHLEDFDLSELVDKDTFQDAYEEKWGGAPWLDTPSKDADVIVLDVTPPSSISSVMSSSTSRKTTFDSEDSIRLVTL
jgi:hypothetical protein